VRARTGKLPRTSLVDELGLMADRSSWQRPQGRGNRASGSTNPSKDGARQQAMTALSGNAWKGKGQGGAERAQAQAQTPSAPAEHHVPVKDFNAGEIKEFLKKSKCAELGAGPRPRCRASRWPTKPPRRIESCF
jgi:hypothetical protein